MCRSKILIISSVVVVLIVASFLIGALYSPYPKVDIEAAPAVMSRTEDLVAYTAIPGGQPAAQERLVIYNAHVSLETTDIEGGLGKIRQLAQIYGGYVTSSSRSTYGVQSRAEMSIRVPKEKFHAAVQEIETYGRVLDEGTTSEDITQQYIDLEARLSNLQEQEERLREILDVAKTVDEILRVESELARVRGEIDSLQGQINYLEGNVEMSLISVALIEPAPPFTPPGMDWGETFEIAITGLFTVLRGMIILGVSLIPLAAVGVPAYYVYRRRKQRKR